MYLFESLHTIIKSYLPDDQIELVKRAFVIARDATKGKLVPAANLILPIRLQWLPLLPK